MFRRRSSASTSTCFSSWPPYFLLWQRPSFSLHARIAAAAPTVAPVGQRSSFTILGSKLAEAKKKKQEEKELEKRRKELMSEPVVEDWSLEVEREEEEKAKSEAGSEHELEAPSSPVA